MVERERFMGVNSIRFYKQFPDEESCYKYISDIKWQDGYVCKKCNGRYSKQCAVPGSIRLAGQYMGMNFLLENMKKGRPDVARRAKNEYAHLEQKPSDKGNNFPELHVHIMNIQGWLRGIHQHCSKEHLQSYLDDYHYRYNRRNHMETIFDNLVKRMVVYEPTRRI